MRKDWIITVILGLVIIIGLGVSGYYKLSKKDNSTGEAKPTSSSTVAGATATYFAPDAKVMYFYSDYCHWCQQEKEVLAELSNDGYKVKPMNVGENPDLWKDYNIEGTPTFVAANGDRLVGFKEKDILKKFLDDHK